MIIYRHIRLDINKTFYIGIGSSYKRAYVKSGRNPLWKNITNKTEYEVEVLKSDLEKFEAFELEKILISFYGRKDLGTGCLCNMSDGGEFTVGRKLTEEHKEKIRRGNLGKTLTPEQCKAISDRQKGKKVSEKERLRLIEIATGRKWNNNQKSAHCKKVAQYTKSGVFIKDYESSAEATKITGISNSNILMCCQNKRKSAGSFIWKNI